MEPVTHLLMGACLSRSGLNRRAAYATLTMVVAAEFPDIDTLWSLRGPIEGFQHHRGITHTFLGLPFEAALLVGCAYGWHRWRIHRAAKATAENPPNPHRLAKPLNEAPLRWGVLYGLALIALSSHLLLDYTNNYGLRPFFPFEDKWYAASIVFILDPMMLVLMVGALIAPWIFALVGSEVGAKKQPFRGRGWAIAALLGIVGWWTLREVEHGHAVQLAMAQSIAAPAKSIAMPDAETVDTGSESPGTALGTDQGVAPAEAMPTYLTAQRALASPDPLNPFHWSAATDFGPLYQLSEIDTRTSSVVAGDTTYPKPDGSAAVLVAEKSKLGRAYLDWSSMPILDVTKPDSQLVSVSRTDGNAVEQVITFRDPRFMGGWMRQEGRSALTGTVSLNTADRVVSEAMDGRVER
jgi:inner membrane protein